MDSQGVIFDMDGTLFDTESVFQEEWNRIAKERGLSLPESFKYEICGTSGDPMNRIIEKYYHVANGTEIQHLCKERVSRRLLAKVPKKPGCREILSFFRKKGYAISIGSSSPTGQILANLAVTGLSSCFDALASGEEVDHGKPAPDIFLLAARKMGIPPSRCYVFEDSPNGIRAACAAGMKAIMVPDLMPVTGEMREKCFAIFESLLEAKEFFAKQS